jgi:hypothetical protein
MSRKVMTPAARVRARRRELRAEMARVVEKMRLALAVLDDEPMPGAERGVILEGKIVDGDKIVTEAETD